jgi:hypothetical protein
MKEHEFMRIYNSVPIRVLRHSYFSASVAMTLASMSSNRLRASASWASSSQVALVSLERSCTSFWNSAQ